MSFRVLTRDRGSHPALRLHGVAKPLPTRIMWCLRIRERRGCRQHHRHHRYGLEDHHCRDRIVQ